MQVVALIEELIKTGCNELSVTPKEGYVERLLAYTRSVSHFPTALKEFEWRNGWFLGLSKEADAQGKPDPCQLHSMWLHELGHM
jgi:hypothetical protein